MGPQELLQITTTQGNLDIDWLPVWLMDGLAIYWYWLMSVVREYSEITQEKMSERTQPSTWTNQCHFSAWWKELIGSGQRIWKSSVALKRFKPTLQNFHGDWLAIPAGWREMPQRLATYSNCVQKPVPFSFNPLKHISLTAVPKNQWMCFFKEGKCVWR